MKMTTAEKRVVKELTDWEMDECVPRHAARLKARKLLRRIKAAGVQLVPKEDLDRLNLSPHELGNTYVGKEDRFVVSLLVSYHTEKTRGGIKTPQQAVGAALALTTDDMRNETHWYCFDRKTQEIHLVQQGDAKPYES